MGKGIFLVHGEPEAREAFAALARARTDAPVLLPELDAVYALPADRAPEPRRAAPRLAPEAAHARFDWHNERAQLLMELRRRLEEAGDDRERADLLHRVRRALDQAPG